MSSFAAWEGACLVRGRPLKRDDGRLVGEAGSGEGGEVTLKTVALAGVADGTPCARGVNEAERMEQLLGLVSVKAFSALRVALASEVRALARAQALGDELLEKRPTTHLIEKPQTACGCARTR